jgi:hypothetical protein
MASTQTGDSTAEQAKEKAQEKAQQAGEQAKGRVRDEVDRRSTEAGEQATSVADAMRQASQQLREQGKESAAKPMEQVAQRVESAGSWLRDSDGDTILRDIEDFGRRKPLAAVAGGLAIGFALSRVLKASSTDRYRGSGGTPSRGRAALPAATSTGTTSTGSGRGVVVPDLPEPPSGSAGTAGGGVSPHGAVSGATTTPATGDATGA